MNEQNTKNTMPAKASADVASGILEGFIEQHPRQASEGIVNLHDVKACLEDVKSITMDAAMQIEEAQKNVEDLAALVAILAQAHLDRDGRPSPKTTAQALDSIVSSLEGISKKLDLVMDQIYKKGE